MVRPVARRVLGEIHGPITRVISPEGLGHDLKPFIFLDVIDASESDGFGFPFHPHSGLATLTYHLDGDVAYEDTGGQKGILRARGMEWMRAGGGVWHQGQVITAGRVRGFQLWVALEPPLELAPARGSYVPPEAVSEIESSESTVRILLGGWKGEASVVTPPAPIDLFQVSLVDGAVWRYTLREDDMTVAWLYTHEGEVEIDGRFSHGELLIFSPGLDPVEIRATGPTSFLFGAARPHPYPLFIGQHSVHSSLETLAAGQKGIRHAASMLEGYRPID
jgi:redox-sensitive bicupin YhaK (pirin superfamily)